MPGPVCFKAPRSKRGASVVGVCDNTIILWRYIQWGNGKFVRSVTTSPVHNVVANKTQVLALSVKQVDLKQRFDRESGIGHRVEGAGDLGGFATVNFLPSVALKDSYVVVGGVSRDANGHLSGRCSFGRGKVAVVHSSSSPNP